MCDPNKKNTCAFFCFEARIMKSIHILIRQKSEHDRFELDTQLALFTGMSLVADTNTHTLKLFLVYEFEFNTFSNLKCNDRGHVNREVQTVNWEAGKKGAVETGVKSGLKKAHKLWIRGKNRVNRELGKG